MFIISENLTEKLKFFKNFTEKLLQISNIYVRLIYR
jgi:hypothetical protein